MWTKCFLGFFGVDELADHCSAFFPFRKILKNPVEHFNTSNAKWNVCLLTWWLSDHLTQMPAKLFVFSSLGSDWTFYYYQSIIKSKHWKENLVPIIIIVWLIYVLIDTARNGESFKNLFFNFIGPTNILCFRLHGIKTKSKCLRLIES